MALLIILEGVIEESWNAFWISVESCRYPSCATNGLGAALGIFFTMYNNKTQVYLLWLLKKSTDFSCAVSAQPEIHILKRL